jgi:hypothetical protein
MVRRKRVKCYFRIPKRGGIDGFLVRRKVMKSRRLRLRLQRRIVGVLGVLRVMVKEGGENEHSRNV